MKKKQVAAVNAAFIPLFAAACMAAAGMATACDKLARAIIGKGRGKDAYGDAVKELAALETASTDGNKHTVRRYTGEALAILAQHGGKVAVPTVAAERTEKAQGARKSLGIKKRGVKAKSTKTAAAGKPMPPQDFETAFRAAIKLQVGRANLIRMANAEGFHLVFSMVENHTVATLPAPALPSEPKPTQAQIVAAKANGAKKPKAEKRAAH